MSQLLDKALERPWVLPVSVAALAGLVLLPLLGSSGLWDPVESMAAEVAREAAQEGSWLPLRYDGEALPGLPPLFHWVEALLMLVAGTSEWAVRLPLALLATCWLVLVMNRATRLMGRSTGLLSALALATSSFLVVGARHTSPDLLAAMLLTLAALQALVVLVGDGVSPRRDAALAHVLAAATLLAGGLLPLACLVASMTSGLLTGTVTGRALARLRPRGWAWAAWAVAGAWIVAGLATSGGSFLSGLWTLHPHARALLLDFEQPPETSFSWQIMQVGHMAYPWFIALPAAVLWLVPASSRLEKEHGEDPRARRACLHVLLAVPILYATATGLVPGYLPLDMLCAAPVLVIVSAWGLSRAVHLVGDERFRILLPLGGVLVMLGAGSQGVDMFWNPKRVLESSGYMFDRVYPELGAVAKGFHTGLAIVVGVCATPVAFARRRPGLITAGLLVSALAIAGFHVVHVFESVEPHLSVGPLARAYREAARDTDRLVAIELDPQIRGGHVFYFRRAMRNAGGLESLPALMDEAAGRGRLIIVTSHVRELYNDAYALTCGQRIEPLNKERRWYSISALESAPHMPSYRIVVDGGRAGARITRPFEVPLTHQGRKAITFLGWNAAVGTPGGATPAGPVDDIRVPRGGWIDLELFFRAEMLLETGWRVLLDAVGIDGTSSLKAHHPPACGRYPTHMWEPGQVVRDRIFFHVPLDTKPGTYRLRTGFYRDSERMRVEVSGGRLARPRYEVTIILGSFIVVE